MDYYIHSTLFVAPIFDDILTIGKYYTLILFVSYRDVWRRMLALELTTQVVAESKSIIPNIPNNEIEKTSRISATTEEIARQIESLNDSLTRQLERLCHVLRELKDEQMCRRHE